MNRIYATMKEDRGKFINRTTTNKGKVYDSFFFYVPASVAKDSSFPFEEGQPVNVSIQGDKVVIEKVIVKKNGQ